MTRPCSSRRHFIQSGSFGLGSFALAWLLRRDGLLGAPVKPHIGEAPGFDLLPKRTHHAPRARAMISLMMIGGPSQMDLFDPKPELANIDGSPFPGDIKYDNAAEASSKTFASPWKFHRRGQCGMELSELLPCLGEIADEICLIRSMRTAVNNHGQSLFALQNGQILGGRPTLGSWLTYGLGSETDELPAYVALTHPAAGPLLQHENWTAGWLPSIYQGTSVRPTEPRLLNLEPPSHLAGRARERQLELLERFNSEHRSRHPGASELQARTASYTLAARMQDAAREAFDISGESEETRALYGIDNPTTRDYGTRCLIARRLVERGVRFVQVFNNGQSWDHHGSILTELPNRCAEIDQPAAALVKDLRRRGLLDETLVHWGGEMGRLPVAQATSPDRKSWGRDHNTYGFSMWLAGGGIRGGHVHGATDPFGHHAVSDVVHHYDYHATVLHLFGLDHTRLTHLRNGAAARLVEDASARLVREILA